MMYRNKFALLLARGAFRQAHRTYRAELRREYPAAAAWAGWNRAYNAWLQMFYTERFYRIPRRGIRHPFTRPLRAIGKGAGT